MASSSVTNPDTMVTASASLENLVAATADKIGGARIEESNGGGSALDSILDAMADLKLKTDVGDKMDEDEEAAYEDREPTPVNLEDTMASEDTDVTIMSNKPQIAITDGNSFEEGAATPTLGSSPITAVKFTPAEKDSAHHKKEDETSKQVPLASNGDLVQFSPLVPTAREEKLSEKPKMQEEDVSAPPVVAEAAVATTTKKDSTPEFEEEEKRMEEEEAELSRSILEVRERKQLTGVH